MKSAVIYYSFSGNTRKVAMILSEYLRRLGEVSVIELKAPGESNNFFTQAGKAFRHKREEIETVELDLAGYDLISLGTPVWAFGPAPAMNSCLDRCSGIKGKRVILFTTYGSGTGNERCLNYMQQILLSKGASSFERFSIQQSKSNDKESVLNEITKVVSP
ncbi:MAG TPA: NAD(P)H-dependent oxidoreductase [Candidatus Margulisiibacteriota bacterium]|nr:NAD(P)H-dependent oxidoreductase [Candidatus Margulisiibacteriota bacterium]